MDIEKRARRQSRRVIISEILMVVTVIITVSILAFVVSGYWVGSDFKIERQGLLQIYSTPTGADVEIDNSPSSWLQRTNTSKTLAAGEHTIKLEKEGYDSWSRTINITEGLLYRLHYPRLFLQNRIHETAYNSSANFATISPDRNTMLLINNTTTWQLLNLDTDTAIKPTELDLSKVLPFVSQAQNAEMGLFTGIISDAKWASDNEHLLLKITNGSATNYLLLSIKNPATSINLTKEFNADFTDVEIINSSATNLLVLLNGNLHLVDTTTKQISAVLVPEVVSFDHYNQNVVFSTKKDIGLLKLGSNEITSLKDISTPVTVAISKFYDDEYIFTIDDTMLTIYLKDDFVKKTDFNLTFHPDKVKVGLDGEALTMYTGGRIITLDMEATKINEWNTETDTFGWLDASMIYAVKDGILNVYDFNGENHRTLSSNVSTHFPITITSDKYLYYFRDGSLIREYLYEK